MLNVTISPIKSTSPYQIVTARKRQTPNLSFRGLTKDVFEKSTPVITKLSKKDFKEIYGLYVKYRESANVKSTVDEVKKFLTLKNTRTGDEFFTEKVQDKNIGFLHFGKEYSTLSGDYRYRIKAMYIEEEYRGKGIAKKLITAMKNFANDKEIIVKARRTNEHSPYLYSKSNFNEDGEYIHYVYRKSKP